ncbi:MAG: hypothetical protein CTY15_14500 [Methylocystis sp.]|nr:MAG: hypothetical protein CTY15_14500 [Methylocystis sp.]
MHRLLIPLRLCSCDTGNFYSSWTFNECKLCAREVAAQARTLAPGTPIESQLQEHGHYSNSSGEDVHAPAHSITGGAPDGASARCRDSTYSFSHSRSGTCSRHGGVGEWLR